MSPMITDIMTYIHILKAIYSRLIYLLFSTKNKYANREIV